MPRILQPFSASPPAQKTYGPETIARQAEMLANRVLKVFKRLAANFEKRQIGVFRLYDWDIPEIRAVVDWYEGHLVVAEYVREQTEGTQWLESMAAAVATALKIPMSQVHLRRRSTRPKQGDRYQRLSRQGERMIVREGERRFWVDLDSYLDTGLFADHRQTRAMVQKESQGKRFLNLYCYTASFSVYAAAGQALSTCNVDLSERYLQWAEDNFKLNQQPTASHEFVAMDARIFLQQAARSRRLWDLIWLDPPSFSNRADQIDFDIQRDHRLLIAEAMAVLAPGGVLYFSTNHQRFRAELNTWPYAENLSKQTTPIDYQGKTPHQLFRFRK